MTTSRHYVHFLAAGTITVVITDPTADEVIGDSAIPVAWTISGGSGVQQAYRVTVFADAALTTPIYQCAWTVGSTGAHTVPAGSIPNMADIWVRVEAADTNGAQGASAAVHATTDFATSVDVTGVRAVALGGSCGDPRQLPHAVITWSQIVPGGSEAFLRYLVLRREPDAATWTIIASVSGVATLRYVDANAAPWVDYDYAVLWLASSGPVTLTSRVQTGVHTRLEFDHAWLHSTTSPMTGPVRLDGWAFQQTLVEAISTDQVWGATAPVATIGEADYSRWHADLHPQLLRDPKQWEKLRALLVRQAAGEQLCFRHGRSRERAFCVVTTQARTLGQVQGTTSLDLTEVDYSEVITL